MGGSDALITHTVFLKSFCVSQLWLKTSSFAGTFDGASESVDDAGGDAGGDDMGGGNAPMRRTLPGHGTA